MTADEHRAVVIAAATATLLARLGRSYIDTWNPKGKGRYVVVPDDVEDIGGWLEDWGHAHRLGHAQPNGDTRKGMGTRV